MLQAGANADDDAERYNVHYAGNAKRRRPGYGHWPQELTATSSLRVNRAGIPTRFAFCHLRAAVGRLRKKGQQSPEGVSSLDCRLRPHAVLQVRRLPKPAVHAANWRFDDEWSNTDGPPSDGWYDTAAEALTTAALNPSFVEADNTLWECRGRFRRRLNNDGDAYVYSDSKEVFAVFGEQFSEDAENLGTVRRPTTTSGSEYVLI